MTDCGIFMLYSRYLTNAEERVTCKRCLSIALRRALQLARLQVLTDRLEVPDAQA